MNDLTFVAIITVFTVGGIIWRKWSVGRLLRPDPERAVGSQDGSAVLAYYTSGHSLISNRGKLEDIAYATYLTMPETSNAAALEEYVPSGALIYGLDLPFNTQSHIVGLSKKFALDRLQFASFLLANGLEKINLEGNFSDYFDIYAKKGQGFEVRYVLDPEAMAYVIDYCSSHFWEINNEQLYLVSTKSQQAGSGLLTESLGFIEQIQPALLPGQPGAAAVHHEVPYGEYDGSPPHCPICDQLLTGHDDWQECPQGHGILINGRDLMRLSSKELNIVLAKPNNADHKVVTCPNCKNAMQPVAYGSKQIQIDSCENCPFRWLDANEVAALS